MSALGEIERAVLAAVEAHPGVTSNGIVFAVGERRQVVLAVLRVLRARGLVRAEPGPRRAAHWFPSPRSGAGERAS